MGFKEQYTNISKHILDTEFMLALQTVNSSLNIPYELGVSVTSLDGKNVIYPNFEYYQN